MVMFLIAFKMDTDNFEKYRKEDKLDKIIKYLDHIDSMKDLVVIISIPVTILFIGKIETINNIDYIQALTAFSLMYFWHLVMFMRRDGLAQLRYVTNFDKLKDTVVIFVYPIVIVSIPLGSGSISTVDIFQAFAAFFLMYGWRKIMFYNAN